MGSVKQTKSYPISVAGMIRPASLIFMEEQPSGSTLVFRIDGDPCTPDRALDIEYIETSMANTGAIRVMRDVLEGARKYPVESPHFMLTDYLINGNPAYWRHKLKEAVWVDAVGRRRVSVVDKDDEEVDDSLWHYDDEQNTLYTLFTNKEDTPSGPKIYYVKYIRANEANAIVDQTHKEILDSEYVCHEVTPLDTNCLNQVRYGSHSYEIDIDGDTTYGSMVVVTLPSTRKHYIEYLRPKKMQLIKPRARDLKQPWYCVIKGKTTFKEFTAGESGILSGVLRYTLKEHMQQNYYPWYPIMPSGLVTADKIASNLYTVRPKNLVVSENTPLTVVVSKNGSVVKAYSTHSMPTSAFKDVKWDIGNIECDQLNGLFVLPDDWGDEYTVQSHFFYYEDGVPYVHKDFNPYTDPDVLKQVTLIYMRPDSETTDRTIYHFVFDRDLNVWPLSGEDNDGIYVSNDPNAHESNEYMATPRVEQNILDSIVNYGSLYENALDAFLANNPSILVLGLVRVGTGVSIAKAEIVDARSPGGGIHPDKVNDALFRTNATLMANDIGGASGIMDGGRNCIVVKVKQSIIDAGFTTEDIERIVSKYTESGVKVLCQVVGEDGW